MDVKKIAVIIVVILVIVVGLFTYISTNTHNTKIEVVSNSTLKNGDAITVVLKDSYRNVYPDQQINIKLLDDSGHSDKYQVTTDSNGEASVELLGLESGNYTIHCEFNGTMFLTQSKTTGDLQITDSY